MNKINPRYLKHQLIKKLKMLAFSVGSSYLLFLSQHLEAANYNVNSEGTLVTALNSVVNADTITFTASFGLANVLPLVKANISIIGNGNILTGSALNPGSIFFVSNKIAQPTVNISNLTLQNGTAQGGIGGQGGLYCGGGGLGAGGALFIDTGATVNLTNVVFLNNAARGGDSTFGNSSAIGGGGGGGLNLGASANGGDGVSSSAGGGGAGGFGTTSGAAAGANGGGGAAGGGGGGGGFAGGGGIPNGGAGGFNAPGTSASGANPGGGGSLGVSGSASGDGGRGGHGGGGGGFSGGGGFGNDLIGGGGGGAVGGGGGGSGSGINGLYAAGGAGGGEGGGGGGGAYGANQGGGGGGGFGGGGGGGSGGGGQGGYGGGAGNDNSSSPSIFGGGPGFNARGGGGAGLGGSIFVRTGGTLNINVGTNIATMMSGGTAIGGTGANFDLGAGLGTGIFLMSYQGASGTNLPNNLNIIINSGVTTAISDTISDDNFVPVRLIVGNGVQVGEIDLTGSNSYHGGTTINSGTVGFNNPNSFGTGNISVQNGGSSAIKALANVSLTNNINLATAGTPSGIDTGNNTLTLTGLISGPGGFQKQGLGTLVLPSANTLTGNMNFGSGIVNVQNNNSLGSGSVTAFTGSTLQAGANLTLANAIISQGNPNIDTQAFNLTLTGLLSGSLPANGYTKLGSGTLTLTNANTYGGGTNITAGTVNVQNNAALGTGPATLASGTILQAGIPSVTLNNLITSNNGIIDTGANAMTLNGIISGTSLTKIGSGVLTLTAANTYNAGTTISAGTLQIGNGGATGSILGNVANSGNLTFNRNNTVTYGGIVSGAGSLTQAGTGTTILTNANSYTGGTTISAGTLQIGNGGTTGSIVGNVTDNGNLTFNRSDAITYGGIVSGTGSLTQAGAGTTILTNANTYTGGTTISAGTLQIGNGGTTGSIVGNVTDNGNLTFNRSDAVTYGGIVSGTGALTQAGTGTTILTNANTYTGGTTISAGTLQIGNGGTTGSIVGNVTDNGSLTFNRSDAVTFGGVISGTGSVIQTGTGTTILSGVNTYAGGTLLQNGILQVSADNNLGNTTSPITFDGGTLQFGNSFNLANTRDLSITSNNGQIDTNGNNTTITQAITGPGALTKSGTGTLILEGANTYNGTTIAGGVLQIGNGGTTGSVVGNITNNASLVFNRSDAITYSDSVSGIGSLTQAGAGVLTLTNANTYTGGTLIANGTLEIGNGGTTGSIIGNIVNNSALVFNRSNTITYNDSISGTGSVSQNGVGTLNLYGTNTHTGGTFLNNGVTNVVADANLGSALGTVTLNGGTLQLGNSFDPAATRVFDVTASGGIFDTNGFNTNVSSSLTGVAGSGFIKTGAGKLNITGNNPAFLSDIFVTGGELGLNGSVGGNVTVNNTGLLSGIGTAFGNGVINSGGTIAPGNGGVGTLHFNGNYTQNSGSTYLVEVNAATSDLIDVAGTATLNGGTVQVFTLSEPSMNTPYQILHADGGVSGTFGQLILPNNFFQAQLIYNPFDVLLGIVKDLITGAVTHNQISVATQLNNAINPPADVQALINSLFSMTDDQVRTVLDLLSGSQYTHLTAIAQLSTENFARRIWDNLRRRTFIYPCEQSTCDSGWNTWFDVDMRNGYQKGNIEAKGYKLNSYDITTGFQKQLTSNWLVGTAFDYEKDHLHFNLSGHGRANTYQGALYALYTNPKGYFFSNLSVGYRNYKVNRRIEAATTHLKARSRSDLCQTLFYNEIGRNWSTKKFEIQPFVGLELGNYYRDRIKEHGAGSFNLMIKGKNRFTVNSRLGLHLFTQLPYAITVGADVAWNHRFNFLKERLTSRFRGFGTNFSIIGVGLDQNSVEGSINASQQLTECINIYGDLFGQRGRRYSSYGVSAGISIDW